MCGSLGGGRGAGIFCGLRGEVGSCAVPPTGLLRLDGACDCGPPGCTLTPTRPPTLPSCLCASPFAALLPSVVCRHQPRPSRAPPHRHARTACRHQRLAGGAPPAALQRRRRRRGHRYLEAAERCLLAAHLSSRKPCTAAGCQAASPAPPYRRQSLSSCSSVFAQAPAHPAHPHRKLRLPCTAGRLLAAAARQRSTRCAALPSGAAPLTYHQHFFAHPNDLMPIHPPTRTIEDRHTPPPFQRQARRPSGRQPPHAYCRSRPRTSRCFGHPAPPTHAHFVCCLPSPAARPLWAEL